jgi:hypothetical protein
LKAPREEIKGEEAVVEWDKEDRVDTDQVIVVAKRRKQTGAVGEDG